MKCAKTAEPIEMQLKMLSQVPRSGVGVPLEGHFWGVWPIENIAKHWSFGRPFVKRFDLCYRTVVLSICPSVLSVTLVYCGQTVGWIKMKLGVQVGLSPGDFVLHGDPALPKRGQSPLPNFPPISIVTKRLDASRCHFVWR